MSLRAIGQVGAGVIAGAVLVGVPTWALANDSDPGSSSGSSQAMSPAACQQVMTTMMNDPALRRQMASMMADAMSQMGDMKGMSNMGGMKGMGNMAGMKNTMPGMGSKSSGN